MAGGSALTKLKSSLHSTNSASNSRSNKGGKKTRSSVSQAYKSSKNAEVAAKLNSFDTIEEKKKFKVVTRGGKLEKGIIKNEPGKSRAAGIELRQRTLLPQLLARNHTSTFIDHRFGETSSSTLSLEEKALERFTAERTSRLSKKTRFNLEDAGAGDGRNNDEGLTHGGRKLGFGDEDELDAGGWGGGAMMNDGGVINSNREPLIGRRMAEGVNEEEEPARKRSKAEIMMEVVAKSKAYKHERQKIKSADDDIRHTLDAGLGDLRLMLGGGIPATDSSLQTGISSKRGKKPIVVEEEEAEDEEEIDEMADMNDDDEDDEDDDDEEGDDDDEEGGVKDLTDKELEEALSTKSGVDRDLLRRLIGKLSSKDDGSDSDDDAEAEMLADAARAAKSAEPKIIPSLPSQAASYSVSSKTDHDRPAFPSIFPTFTPTASADPYDSYVRLLALEPRAQASDRLKTSLELAREEVERLGIMEKKRLRRERGEDSESDDEETKKAKLKKKRAPQGDDLDDDYAMDGSDEEGADEQLGQGLVGGFGNQIIELQEPVVVEEKSEEEEEDEEDEDDDDNAMDLEDLEGSDEEVGGEVEALVSGERLPTTNIFDKKARTWTGQSAPSIDSLPFTFPCPSTHADFLRLLATAGIVPGKGNEEESKDGTITVIKRIRTLYHPGLGDGNKEKLQIFTSVLLDHILHLSSLPIASASTPYRSINALLPHLLTLSHAYPLTTAPLYIGKLALLSKNFLKGISSGALDPSSRTWPGLAELNILRLVGMTWSTSDLSHPVAAAALLVIGQYLSPQTRIRSLEDIASGLFLCTLVAQYEERSKRYVPEVMGFLEQTIGILLPTTFRNRASIANSNNSGTKIKSSRVIPGSFSTPDWGTDHVKGLKLRTNIELIPSTTVNLPESLRVVPRTPAVKGSKKSGAVQLEQIEITQKKVDLIATTFKVLESFVEMYVTLEAFVEIITPVEEILTGVITTNLPESIKTEIATILTSLNRMLSLSSSSRQPLLLQAHKPIPLATFIPKFDETYNHNRAFDPDTERAEKSKLKKLFKQEKKGAIRELRKDNKFLAGEESKRKAEEAVVYAKKIAKIMGGLQDERAEEKQLAAITARGKRQDKNRRK